MRMGILAAFAAAALTAPAGAERAIDLAPFDPWGPGYRPSRRGSTSGLTRNGGRSKYLPHIGAKERGRWAGKRLS